MPYGIVSHFQFSKNIGFIQCPELNKEKIYFHSSHCISGYHAVQIGDEVHFDLFAIDPRKSEARSISLLGNPGLDELITSFRNGSSRKGRLVKFGKRYLAEDDRTGIFTKIEFEDGTDPDSFFSERIDNPVVEYVIDSIGERNELKGSLLNDSKKTGLRAVLHGESTRAMVMATVKGGFSVRFLDHLQGFIPFYLATRFQPVVEPGDWLEVTLIKADLSRDNYVFDLTESQSEKEARRLNRIRSIPEYRIGDVLTGTICHTLSYGVFVGLGETDGFLHISEVLGEKCQVPSTARRRMSAAMKEVFQAGTSIEVEIRQLSKDKITLTWDPTNETNYALYAAINSQYKMLKELDGVFLSGY